METSPSIAIVIATYKRPEALMKLLSSLADLHFTAYSPTIKLVIVDNSIEQEAEAVVCALQERMPYETIYDLEPRKGLSFVRNKTVEVAGDVDLIAFVDDDEVASPQWIEALLTALDKYGADIVRGPVISRYGSEPPLWIKQRKFFQRPKYQDGRRLMNASTNNVLVKTAWLKKIDPPFDPRFNRSGAEDSFLFRQLHRRGAKIVWAENAVVEEVLPDDRLTAKWILTREFQIGNTTAFVTKRLERPFIPIIWQTIRNLTKIVLGLIFLPISLFFGKGIMVEVLRYLCYGAGFILGLFGYQYLGY